MMKAKYLIALVCISLAACGDNSREPTTSSSLEPTTSSGADRIQKRIQKLKGDLDKTFGTGPIKSARMEADGMHVETEGKGEMVIPLKDLKKLEQGASTDVEKDPISLHLQLFNDANAQTCTWVNCDGWPGQMPETCPYGC